MIISMGIIIEFEKSRRKSIPGEFKKYLLVKYGQEPFPYEFTEQDLYANIERDVCDYAKGKLDITVKRPSERLREECDYLRDLCIEKLCEIRELEGYIAELEDKLTQHGLTTTRMAEKQRDDF